MISAAVRLSLISFVVSNSKDHLVQVHTLSTNRVYLSQWRLFESWCLDRGLDPVAATSVVICDFFLYLFKERKIQVKSIEGYRSALTFILKRSSGYDLSSCQVVADLFRGFKLERPPRPRTEVAWDVSVVLRFLQSDTCSAPTASPRWLTLKTLFLVALAAGKRRSELHALERATVIWSPDSSSVSLKPHPRFLSKTHLSNVGTTALSVITLPALPVVDDSSPALCPVRTLRQYIEVTDAFRSPTQKALFMSYVRSFDRDISPQTISNYLKQTIVAAYKDVESLSDDAIAHDLNIKAHQVRHVAHSLGQLGQLSLADIIRTGGWSTPNTFIKHYLQPLSNDVVDKLHSVGSFVAIESVFQPKHIVNF